MDKSLVLTYVVLTLITIGALISALDSRFAGVYQTFSIAILSAKGVGQLASFGNAYIAPTVPNTNPNPME